MTDHAADPVVALPSSAVWSLAGIAPSTLNYWVQLGLVTPTVRRPHGRRAEQLWSIEDVVIVRAVRALRAAGVSMRRVRAISRDLTRMGHSLASTKLVWNGHDLVLMDPDGTLTSTRRHGQTVLRLDLPIDEWHRQAKAKSRPIDPVEIAAKDRRLKLAQESRARKVALGRETHPASTGRHGIGSAADTRGTRPTPVARRLRR